MIYDLTTHGTDGIERYRNLLSGRYDREKAIHVY